MDKKGLSEVVTTLIIILISFIALGMIWVVVKNVITEGSDKVELGSLMVDLEIEKVTINEANVEVIVKRNVGKSEFNELKIIISDGVESQVFTQGVNLDELGQVIIPLDYIGLVKEVSIAPVLKTESGKEETGKISDTLEFDSKDIIKNIPGLISWWRFEGNPGDEVGGNHGTIFGNVNCRVSGKFGKACYFDGENDYINCGANNDLNITGEELSAFAWINRENIDQFHFILGNERDCCQGTNTAQYGGYGLSTGEGGEMIRGDVWKQLDTFQSKVYGNSIINAEQWYHAGLVVNVSNLSVYVNGIQETSKRVSTRNIMGGPAPFIIGTVPLAPTYWEFKGKIDEVMVFDRALSNKEIKALYNLDLS